MGWPQYTYLALLFVSLGVCLAKHGEPKGNHNFGLSLVAAAIVLGLLWAGGFFGGAQ